MGCQALPYAEAADHWLAGGLRGCETLRGLPRGWCWLIGTRNWVQEILELVPAPWWLKPGPRVSLQGPGWGPRTGVLSLVGMVNS